jgi:hypothetical protein
MTPPLTPDPAAANHPPLTPAAANPSLTPDLAAIMTEVVGSGGHSGRFGHREHIYLAFVAARRGDATGLLRDWLRQIAASHGTPGRYHETITTAWAQIVAHHLSADPAIASFDSFAARYPALLDKSLLSRHYSQAALASPTARATWIAPDLTPIPDRPLPTQHRPPLNADRSGSTPRLAPPIPPRNVLSLVSAKICPIYTRSPVPIQG